ncbi:hypothetical protein PAHAL_8G197900 [Panicum hallii]|uniref:Knottin scorpion toxin-like domain-containing protein n=1 Tax=Panicum hallii TaxID=206008 RepID=A0A270R5L7_9POAL|nr:hypothetical protein PAHAL_8G197900 [Panicum hallii]
MALGKTSAMRTVYLAAALLLFLETMSSSFPSCQARSGWSRPDKSLPSPPPSPSPSPPRWDTCFSYAHCMMSRCSVHCVSRGYRGVGSRCVKHNQTVTMECCCKIHNNVR